MLRRVSERVVLVSKPFSSLFCNSVETIVLINVLFILLCGLISMLFQLRRPNDYEEHKVPKGTRVLHMDLAKLGFDPAEMGHLQRAHAANNNSRGGPGGPPEQKVSIS